MRWLFLDMNAFFASVEQQVNPELRGKPVIVAPVMTDSTVAIAASYEAKKYGIRTGTIVRDAKKLCPELLIVEGNHANYREFHHKIVEVVEGMFATVKVLSVDEMACRLSPLQPESELEAARRVKREIKEKVGEWLCCSIGVAPNIFLAKVASETQKPDGLTIWRAEDLPQASFCLGLRDLPGIGPKMHVRLMAKGISTVEELYRASENDLERVTGSIVGKRWYHMLRGSSEVDYGQTTREERKTVGHSHVLPPKLRNSEGVEQVLLRLMSKALHRLREYNQMAGAVFLAVKYVKLQTGGNLKNYWKSHSSGHQPADDDVTWTRIARGLLAKMPTEKPGYFPLQVAITFTDLKLRENVTGSLFETDDPRDRGSNERMSALSETVDGLNQRFGYMVDLASVFWLKDRAPDRISFGTSLLNSGELKAVGRTAEATEEEVELLEGFDYETDEVG
jgi:DNA polymerase IV